MDDAEPPDRPDGDGGPGRPGRQGRPAGRAPDEEGPDMDDLFDELVELEESVDTDAEREQVRETMRVAMQVSRPSVFGKVIHGFDRADFAEALLGSVLFGIPMLVEGGTQEVGEFLAPRPALLAGTVGFGVALVVSILYVADIQDVRVHEPFLGFVPRRLVGVLGVSGATALVAMTGWGRVDWATPSVALAQCAVAFVPMAIGAALGDILPGS